MNSPYASLDLTGLPLDCLYIGGRWIKAGGDKTIPVVSPDDGLAIAQVAEATEADIDAAVEAARNAFDSGAWATLPLDERLEYVQALSDGLAARSEELASYWSAQIGVSRQFANRSAPFLARSMEQYIQAARKMDFVERRPLANGGEALLAHEPVGVVAAISPWNVPLSTMLNKIGPALVAGCTVIMKPSPETPLEAYVIAQEADRIGLPGGVLNLVCAQRDVSDYLVRKPDIDKVSFTGSLAAGRRIASVCGDRIARVTLELGGKSAAIILDDFELKKAADALVQGLCSLSGQNCALLSRAFVSRARQAELVDLLVAASKTKKVGHSWEDGIALGPVAMRRQYDRIRGLIDSGVAEGAKLAAGGVPDDQSTGGLFILPTIFFDVANTMQIAREEIFGPVLCVIPYDDIDEAIAMANDSPFGLAGAVFTNDPQAGYAVARRLRTGTVSQNSGRADFSVGFGGFKQSGLGREGGIAGLRGYLESKTILLESIPERL